MAVFRTPDGVILRGLITLKVECPRALDWLRSGLEQAHDIAVYGVDAEARTLGAGGARVLDELVAWVNKAEQHMAVLREKEKGDASEGNP